MDATITVTGNLGADPRIRAVGTEQHLFTEFSIAHTPRVQRDGAWQDGTTTWYRITCWRRLAENAFNSLRRGDGVIVHGRVRTHEWADKDGVVQTRDVVEALSIGPDLNRGTVVVIRRSRNAESRPVTESAPVAADGVEHDPQDLDSGYPGGSAFEAAALEGSPFERVSPEEAGADLSYEGRATEVEEASPGGSDAYQEAVA
ncbi:single-stranded DNA-binding protein [Raineyella fluvialis]|uniref:Single-stranded DNA-binding protein n=1 Tax=Raineyella fluvialis TaxID=2662261 RepID=A0A5Q2FAJ9_9ACTN|nr:single-stranded DNA-binding protein [Raineyella fluvialis]QGF22384.1 single-stranded DNA-binding protein [Raineyella fluvialis]